jgi:trimethylamine--corrinoid protein Co-methyltransferase
VVILGKASYNLLSRSEVEDIHRATIEVLELTGLNVPSKMALEILDKAGANVDHEKSRVTIPEHVVKEALNKAPKTIKYCARNPKYDFVLEKKKTHFGTDGYAVFIKDWQTGERRYSKTEDLARWATLADYLPMAHNFWPSVAATEVPESIQFTYAMLTSLRNIGKHVEGEAKSAREARYQIEIAAAIVGGEEELRKRPIISAVACPVAPLGYETGLLESTIEFSKAGIPVVPLAMPVSGQTSPMTIAGTLVVNNAEVLGNLVICEFASSGAPVLYAGCPSSMDLKTGKFICAPESELVNGALTSLARYYDLPCEISGGASNSNTFDVQAGYERALGMLATSLTGPDILCCLGGLEASNTMCPELLVIDNEIAEEVERMARGFEVNPDTLAVDVIRGVGPGGHFLAQKHTIKHMRTEQWVPKISNLKTYGAWEEAGSKDIGVVAREKIKEILATHRPEPLSKDVEEDVSEIMKRYEKEFIGQG